MMAVGRAGRKENCFTVSSWERWNGCGVVGAMGVGTGRQEMTTARNSLPFLAGVRRILLHLATLQHRNRRMRGDIIKGKHPHKGVRVGAGRGGGPDRDTGVGEWAAGGAGAARTVDGGVGGISGEGGARR